MVVLLILVLSCLVLRGLGFAGISAFSTWQTSARDALSLMLVFTGACEIAVAVALLLPEFRRAAAYALITFFLAVLPANIHAARSDVTIRGKRATSLWLRIPMQVLFIAVAFWSAR